MGRVMRRGWIALALLALMAFWAELLWYESLGFEGRFWTFTLARIAAIVLGAAVAALVPWLFLRRSGAHLRRVVTLAAAIGGALWGASLHRMENGGKELHAIGHDVCVHRRRGSRGALCQ